ncbi:MAG: BatA and WFA domain-containing protein [Planctomycetaceae bacterium]|nr:BatA and WFA domain-containing protein [Planctomycetaceae bacterium]
MTLDAISLGSFALGAVTLGGPWGWLGWAVLACVPVLIFLLYFLKLRRSRLEVPSTFLWKRSIEDLQVNSLWQRLRSTLLLWLQLAIAILLLLSMLPIGCQSDQRVGQRHIFLLDTSASMAAREGESTRFELAKQQIDAQLSQLREIDLAMLMTSDDQAQIRQAYTSDSALLRRKLQDVTVRPRLTKFDDALIAATALANPSHVRDAGDQLTSEQVANELQKNRATLHMYSDGGFPPIKDTDLGELVVNFVPTGGANSNNLAITTFNAQWNEKNRGSIDLFARIENFSEAPVPIDVELRRNGEIIDVVRREAVEPRAALSLDFQDTLPAQQDSVTEYQLKIVGSDDLLLDDTAHSVVNPGRRPQVMLVTSGNPGLEAVLSTTLIAEGLELLVQSPEFLETDAYQAMVDQPLFDLVVFDRVSPKKLPMANTMSWGAAPSSDWQLTPLTPPVFVLFGNNTHPLTLNLNLDTLAFLKASGVKGPPATVDLLTANDGVLIAVGPRVGFQDLVLGFTLTDEENGVRFPVTDWPGRISFPVFMFKTLEYLGRLGQKEIASSVRPGQVLRFRLESEETELKVVSPGGKEARVNKLTDGGFVFSGTDELGIYRVIGKDEKHVRSFAVSLSDRRESDLAVKSQTMVGDSAVTATTESKIQGDSKSWRYLLLLALGVLCLEWIVYNRRILM